MLMRYNGPDRNRLWFIVYCRIKNECTAIVIHTTLRWKVVFMGLMFSQDLGASSELCNLQTHKVTAKWSECGHTADSCVVHSRHQMCMWILYLTTPNTIKFKALEKSLVYQSLQLYKWVVFLTYRCSEVQLQWKCEIALSIFQIHFKD